MKLLLCSNGSPASRPALDYGLWLADLLHAELTLLGIVENASMRQEVRGVIDSLAERPGSHQDALRVVIREGRVDRVIPGIAGSDDYLTVLGPMGRSFWSRSLRGKAIIHILDAVETPLLYVPVAHQRLQHMLLCLGGLGLGRHMVEIARQLGRATGADATLLHVLETVTYKYPVTEALTDDSVALLETDTPQARHLRASLQLLQEANLPASLTLREGFVRAEILAEINSGKYDLVGLGSHHASPSLRARFTPNITNEIAAAARCPVLVVR